MVDMHEEVENSRDCICEDADEGSDFQTGLV